MTLTEEIQKRRTFAIISHPDAGKTTLTEKLLLYGGAINVTPSAIGWRLKSSAAFPSRVRFCNLTTPVAG